VSEELTKVRKALWCNEGELQGLRNIVLGLKEELGEMRDVRSKLGEELAEE
jgi:hypothetical protein